MWRWKRFASLAAAVLAGFCWGAPAAAQPPERLETFRFIPSRSVLEVTGGIAGIE